MAQLQVGPVYENRSKGFASGFLTFSRGGRLEVMTTAAFAPVVLEPGAQRMGYYESVVLDPEGNRVEITAAT